LTDTPVDTDVVLCGRRLHAARLRLEAERLTNAGVRVTLFLFEPTPRAHKARYTDGGWWEQRGAFMVDQTGNRRDFSFGAQKRAYPRNFAASLPQGLRMIRCGVPKPLTIR
jgi:hypothetical protein